MQYDQENRGPGLGALMHIHLKWKNKPNFDAIIPFSHIGKETVK